MADRAEVDGLAGLARSLATGRVRPGTESLISPGFGESTIFNSGPVSH